MPFVRDVAANAVVRVVTVALSVASSILIARALQPHGLAIYRMASTGAQVAAMFGSFGIAKAAVYYRRRGEIERDTLAATVLGGSMLAGILSAGTLAALGVLGWSLGVAISVSVLVAASTLAALFVIFAGFEGLLRGDSLLAQCNRAQLATPITFVLIVTGLVLYSRLSPATALAAIVISQLVSGLIYIASYKRAGGSISIQLGYPVLRTILAYGLSYQAVVLLQTLHYRSDVYLVGYFLGTTAAGGYALATSLAEVMMNLPLAISFALVPRLTVDDSDGAAAATAMVARHTVCALALCALAFGAAAPLLIQYGYGGSFGHAVAPFRALLPGIVMAGLYHTASSYLLGKNRIADLILINGVALVVNVILNIILLPVMNLVGAAFASTLTYTLAAFMATNAVACSSGIARSTFVMIGRHDWIAFRGHFSAVVQTAAGAHGRK